MIEQLREKIFAWISKRQPARQVVMYPWREIRSVVILHEGMPVNHIAALLEKEGKQVEIIALPPKEDICWLTAMPKKHIREKIRSRHYDLLIDLTQQTDITMQYLAMYIQAGMKTGRSTGTPLYDLSIDTPSQDKPDFLYQQIVKYIQMFTQR